MVLSDSVIRHFKQKGIDFPTEVFHEDPLENFQEEWEKISQDFPDIAYVADTPEELAEKIFDLSVTYERTARPKEAAEEPDENFLRQQQFNADWKFE